MKTLKLKFALLALAAVGMLSISSCKKEKNTKERLFITTDLTKNIVQKVMKSKVYSNM